MKKKKKELGTKILIFFNLARDPFYYVLLDSNHLGI